MTEKMHLSELASGFVVRLEQTSRTNGRVLLDETARARNRCPTIVGPMVSGALEELQALGLIDSYAPGCRRKDLACCVPLLTREFVLTAKGHGVKISNLSYITGISARRLNHE